MTQKVEPWFLHVDLDAFFASVEQLDNPSYRGKPVIVGGKPEDRRSVVSTASYEARKYGVHSAMPTAQAYKLCPNGIFVYGRMQRYSELSYKIMQILNNYSPDVQQMSIDEAFVDLTGTEKIFGPPEETAIKIKQEIFNNTGLTVSIGLASSKYFAKIASDINKPNGFYFVKPGDEQNFMLSLRLKDIFGLGTKSQERLKQLGIKTTKDLYERSYESLTFLCGENQGSFLYNVVRGKIEDQFSRKAKTHSISTETTFSYDIYDSYALETCLMNLSYNLRFRLLKENAFCKTIMIKIRYEDFTTVSIQQTYGKNILTIDDLFIKAKELFQRKWEKNRGIRLLGLALENIEKEEKPFQQDLFENSNHKQEKVEKAILNLSKKHPEIKVHKARMLEKIKSDFPQKTKILFFAFFICFSFLFPNKIYSQENQNTTENENNINYEISGFWDLSLFYSPSFSFGKNFPLNFSTSLPIFKQEIDLNININFLKNWNFILNFAENFDQNTFTIKYQGDNYLKQFLLSNRNVVFPDYYAANIFGYGIGGGKNEAPGLYLHFEDYKNNKFSSDFLLRYDLTLQKNAIFYGKNKVTDLYIQPNNFAYGKLFYIPFEYIKNIENIYVENTNGTILDSDGKRYKKLSSNDFLIDTKNNVLRLNDSSLSAKQSNFIPKILITFKSTLNKDDFGDYSIKNSYLGQIQSFVEESPTNKKINLQHFAFELTKKIQNKDALVIQNNTAFSPFLICNQYDFGLFKESELYVIDNSSKQKNNNYLVTNSDFNIFDLEENFFKEKHLYAQVFKNTSSFDYSLAQNRYPFFYEDPYIYLHNTCNSNLVVLQRSYTAVSNFEIGRNVESSSIKVLINGLSTNNFSYSESTGFVTINQNVIDSDRIYITWNEQSSTTLSQNKLITIGAGFKYNFLENLKSDTLFTFKIPFAPNINYSTVDTNFTNLYALSTGLSFTKGNFTFNNALSFSLENPNTTGTLIVSSQNKSTAQTFYHDKNIVYKTQVTPYLNCTNSVTLEAQKKYENTLLQTKSDASFSSYKIPLEWDFLENQNWTSLDVKLSKSNLLSNANKIEFSYKNESASDLSGYRFFIQLGINAEDSFYGEDVYTIPTWDITPLLNLTNQNTWNTFELSLDNSLQDIRSKFITYSDMRIIVYNETSEIKNGIICFGPYEVKYKSLNINSTSNNVVSSYYLDTSSPAYKEYYKDNSTDFYSEQVFWNDVDKNNNQLIAQKYLPQTNYQDYENINIDFAYQAQEDSILETDNNNFLTFVLLDENKNESIKIELYKTLLNRICNKTLTWHKLSISTKEHKVYLDDAELVASEYFLSTNELILPVQEQIVINTQHTTGYFYNGNIYFTKTNTNFYTKNNINFEYKNETLQGKISSPFITIHSTQNFYTKENNFSSNIDSSLSSGIKLFDFELKNDISFVFQEKQLSLNNFSFTVNQTKPLFKFLLMNTNFSYNRTSQYSKKDDFVSLDFNTINFPLLITVLNSAQNSLLYSAQNINTNINFIIPIYNTKLNTKILSNLEQKANKNTNNTFNPFYSEYKDLLFLQFTNLKDSKRSINFNLESTLFTNKNNINPKIVWNINSINEKENINNPIINKAKVVFEFPFSVKKQSFNINYSKSFVVSNKQNNSSTNYTSDITQLLNTQNQLSSFYFSLPIKELFETVNNNHYNLFNSNSFNYKYELFWKRQLSNSTKDIFIPLSSSISFTRDINYIDSFNDIYQFKITKTNRFVNLLTKNPNRKLLKSFSQDEYTSYSSFVFKLPNNKENYQYLFSGYKNLLLYFNPKNTLRTSFDFLVSDLQNWQLRFSEQWVHTGNYSIIEVLPKLIFKQLDNQDKQINRKEIVNINVSKTNNINCQTYELIHYCEVILNKSYNINLSFGTSFTYTEEKALLLNIPLSLGLKISF